MSSSIYFSVFKMDQDYSIINQVLTNIDIESGEMPSKLDCIEPVISPSNFCHLVIINKDELIYRGIHNITYKAKRLFTKMIWKEINIRCSLFEFDAIELEIINEPFLEILRNFVVNEWKIYKNNSKLRFTSSVDLLKFRPLFNYMLCSVKISDFFTKNVLHKSFIELDNWTIHHYVNETEDFKIKI